MTARTTGRYNHLTAKLPLDCSAADVSALRQGRAIVFAATHAMRRSRDGDADGHGSVSGAAAGSSAGAGSGVDEPCMGHARTFVVDIRRRLTMDVGMTKTNTAAARVGTPLYK